MSVLSLVIKCAGMVFVKTLWVPSHVNVVLVTYWMIQSAIVEVTNSVVLIRFGENV